MYIKYTYSLCYSPGPLTDVETGDNSCSTALQNRLGDRGSPFLNQPLWLVSKSASHLNCRKLTELPHALAQQGEVDMLKELLCSLQWQQAIITGFSSSDLVAEFSNLVPVVPENKYVSYTVIFCS